MNDQTVDLVDLPLAAKVDCLLSAVFGGKHRVRKVTNKQHFFEVCPYGTLATWDDDKLTRLVFAAHRFCIRAEITTNGMHGLKIMLHNRKTRVGRIYERHPTLEQALGVQEQEVETP